MTLSPAKKEAIKRYKKKNAKYLSISLFPGDQDIIDHLAKQENKSGYVKSLIRADIAKKGAEH